MYTFYIIMYLLCILIFIYDLHTLVYVYILLFIYYLLYIKSLGWAIKGDSSFEPFINLAGDSSDPLPHP